MGKTWVGLFILIIFVGALASALIYYIAEPNTYLLKGAYFHVGSPLLINALLVTSSTILILAVFYNVFHRSGLIASFFSASAISALGALATLLVTTGIYSVIEHYHELNRPRVLLLIGYAIPVSLGLLLSLFGISRARQILSIQAVLCLLYLVSMDVSYRLGYVRNPFVGVEQYAYHWNLYRTSDINYTQSPVRYIDEIKDLGQLVPKNSRFFSDTHTSYYIKSMLPLYAANPKHHHRRTGYSITQSDIEYVCKGGNDQYDAFFNNLSTIRVEYVVINSDTKNVNLSRDCVYQSGPRLSTYLSAKGQLLYKGKFLSLYKLPDSLT